MWRYFLRSTVLAALFFITAGAPAQAQSLTLQWDPPTDTATAGYILKYGTASGVYTAQIKVGLVTLYQVNNLSPSVRYYFVVQAYNADGVLSSPSNQVSAIAPSGTSGGSGGGGGGGGGTSGGGTTGGGGGGTTAVSAGASASGAASTSVVAYMKSSRYMEISWLPVGGVDAYRVEVGTSSGQTTYSAHTGTTVVDFDTTNAPAGAYYVRVRPMVGGVPQAASNEAVVAGGGMPLMDTMTDAAGSQCVEGPGAPRQFTSGANGTSVHLAWQPGTGPVASSYLLQVGSSPGLQNLMTVPLAGGQTSLAATAANGFYALRMISMNSCGASLWGAESLLTVGAASAAATGPVPGAPGTLTYQLVGTLVSLSWTAPAGATRYLIEASMAGGSVSFDTGNPTPAFAHPDTPPGEYVVTVRAGNASGFGPPSNPVTIRVQ